MRVGILFDLDGTLLDTLQDLTDSVNYALKQFGCPARSPREIRSFLGSGVAHLLKSALPGKPDDPELSQVLEVYKDYYSRHNCVKTAPYPGVLQAMAVLGEAYPLAIVSNKHHEAAASLCKHFFGENIYALGERGDCPRKPAPDMLLKAMAELGVEGCIYVGDSEVDLETAKNTNVPCLCVTWGFRDEGDLKAAGAKETCASPEQLAEQLIEMVETYYGQ